MAARTKWRVQGKDRGRHRKDLAGGEIPRTRWGNGGYRGATADVVRGDAVEEVWKKCRRERSGEEMKEKRKRERQMGIERMKPFRERRGKEEEKKGRSEEVKK